jgi:hypothetical protein
MSVLGDAFIALFIFSFIFLVLSLVFLVILRIITSINNHKVNNQENPKNNEKDNKDNFKKYDPFVLSFRKTRTEQIMTSKIEEIGKTRDIQFVVSTYHYNNKKSINGCVYIVTSKILYKLYFIKNSFIYKDIHTFSTFISPKNKKIYSIIKEYLSNNNNYEMHPYHNEFYTWSHYYLLDNYKIEEENLEKFFKNL